MVTTFVPARVLGTAEARKELPAILERFRHEGAEAEPVFIGSYRRAEAVVLSAALAERLSVVLEDLILADRLRERLAASGEPIGGDIVEARLGLDRGEIDREKAALRRERGSQ